MNKQARNLLDLGYGDAETWMILAILLLVVVLLSLAIAKDKSTK